MSELRIGTRGSDLAMWQAEYVREALQKAHPQLRISIEVIRTWGDQAPDTPVHAVGGTGVFTTEIVRALLDGSVDAAVHSLKDLPTRITESLAIAAVTEREDPADVLVAKDGLMLAELPQGAAVMTGSPRRRAQLQRCRPDLLVQPVRGNVTTRLKKFEEARANAIVLARAGLLRLGLGERITQRLDPAEFVPACGQGALAVQVRADDKRAWDFCRPLDDYESRAATSAERSFLAALQGGCRAPIGAYATYADTATELTITGMVANLDGSRLLKRTISGRAAREDEAIALGKELADSLRADGCDAILVEVKDQLSRSRETSP